MNFSIHNFSILSHTTETRKQQNSQFILTMNDRNAQPAYPPRYTDPVIFTAGNASTTPSATPENKKANEGICTQNKTHLSINRTRRPPRLLVLSP